MSDRENLKADILLCAGVVAIEAKRHWFFRRRCIVPTYSILKLMAALDNFGFDIHGTRQQAGNGPL